MPRAAESLTLYSFQSSPISLLYFLPLLCCLDLPHTILCIPVPSSPHPSLSPHRSSHFSSPHTRHSLDAWDKYKWFHFLITAYSSLWKFRMYVVGINLVSSSGKPNNVSTSSRPQISTQSKPRAVSRLPHHMSSCLRRPPVMMMRMTS